MRERERTCASGNNYNKTQPQTRSKVTIDHDCHPLSDRTVGLFTPSELTERMEKNGYEGNNDAGDCQWVEIMLVEYTRE